MRSQGRHIPEMFTTPLVSGMEVDGFILFERVYQGGMANLWRVTRPGSDLPMVMKVPRIRGGEDPATIVCFEVELMLMPMLCGIHVPRFIAKGDFTKRPYIVMEHIEGDTLYAQLDHRPMPIEKVARIGAQIATALHDLHGQHVIHLDIKPANIMFKGEHAVLVDFGTARHDHLPDLLEEEFRIPMGTGPYMSPEQVQHIRDDPRSDFFALGVILYELTTGVRPFGQPSSVAGLRKRLHQEPVPVRQLRPDCPPWLQEIILRCMEVKPTERYETGSQLAFDLQNPHQVVLTRRAQRTQTGGFFHALRRRLHTFGHPATARSASASTPTKRNAIFVAALDLDSSQAQQEALLATMEQLLRSTPNARIACVTVQKTARIGMDTLVDAQGYSIHVKLLVGLKHWAGPLVKRLGDSGGDSQSRITFHVLEAPDAAAAIVDYARRNAVAHIVLLAKDPTTSRRSLSSTCAQVANTAPCTVTLVRTGESDN